MGADYGAFLPFRDQKIVTARCMQLWSLIRRPMIAMTALKAPPKSLGKDSWVYTSALTGPSFASISKIRKTTVSLMARA